MRFLGHTLIVIFAVFASYCGDPTTTVTNAPTTVTSSITTITTVSTSSTQTTTTTLTSTTMTTTTQTTVTTGTTSTQTTGIVSTQTTTSTATPTTTTTVNVMITGTIVDFNTATPLPGTPYAAYNVNTDGSRGSSISSGTADGSGMFMANLPASTFVELEITPSGSYPITHIYFTVPPVSFSVNFYTASNTYVNTSTGGMIAITLDGITNLLSTDTCIITGVNGDADVLTATSTGTGTPLVVVGQHAFFPETTGLKKNNVPVGLATATLNGSPRNINVFGNAFGTPRHLTVVFFN